MAALPAKPFAASILRFAPVICFLAIPKRSHAAAIDVPAFEEGFNVSMSQFAAPACGPLLARPFYDVLDRFIRSGKFAPEKLVAKLVGPGKNNLAMQKAFRFTPRGNIVEIHRVLLTAAVREMFKGRDFGPVDLEIALDSRPEDFYQAVGAGMAVLEERAAARKVDLSRLASDVEEAQVDPGLKIAMFQRLAGEADGLGAQDVRSKALSAAADALGEAIKKVETRMAEAEKIPAAERRIVELRSALEYASGLQAGSNRLPGSSRLGDLVGSISEMIEAADDEITKHLTAHWGGDLSRQGIANAQGGAARRRWQADPAFYTDALDAALKRDCATTMGPSGVSTRLRRHMVYSLIEEASKRAYSAAQSAGAPEAAEERFRAGLVRNLSYANAIVPDVVRGISPAFRLDDDDDSKRALLATTLARLLGLAMSGQRVSGPYADFGSKVWQYLRNDLASAEQSAGGIAAKPSRLAHMLPSNQVEAARGLFSSFGQYEGDLRLFPGLPRDVDDNLRAAFESGSRPILPKNPERRQMLQARNITLRILSVAAARGWQATDGEAQIRSPADARFPYDQMLSSLFFRGEGGLDDDASYRDAVVHSGGDIPLMEYYPVEDDVLGLVDSGLIRRVRNALAAPFLRNMVLDYRVEIFLAGLNPLLPDDMKWMLLSRVHRDAVKWSLMTSLIEFRDAAPEIKRKNPYFFWDKFMAALEEADPSRSEIEAVKQMRLYSQWTSVKRLLNLYSSEPSGNIEFTQLFHDRFSEEFGVAPGKAKRP